MCLKRRGNPIIFSPENHSWDFIPIFSTNFHVIFVLFRSGVSSLRAPKSHIMGLNCRGLSSRGEEGGKYEGHGTPTYTCQAYAIGNH